MPQSQLQGHCGSRNEIYHVPVGMQQDWYNKTGNEDGIEKAGGKLPRPVKWRREPACAPGKVLCAGGRSHEQEEILRLRT